jgi:hypothetical protein
MICIIASEERASIDVTLLALPKPDDSLA